MNLMTSKIACLYLTNKLEEAFPDYSFESIVFYGAIDNSLENSIGVFIGSENRADNKICLGGLSCTNTRVFPVSIKIRWGQDSDVADTFVNKVYEFLLKEKGNIHVGTIEIAYINLIDAFPASLGRDEGNICEFVIRANFVYYS